MNRLHYVILLFFTECAKVSEAKQCQISAKSAFNIDLESVYYVTGFTNEGEAARVLVYYSTDGTNYKQIAFYGKPFVSHFANFYKHTTNQIDIL